MMQPELLQPSWPFYNVINSPLDQTEQYCSLSMDSHEDGFEFSSLFSSIDTCSEISQIPFPSSMFSSGDLVQVSVCDDPLQVMSPIEDFRLSGEIDGIWEESVESFPSQQVSMEGNDLWSPSSSTKSDATMDVTSIQTASLMLPGDNMEIENEITVRHLLTACGEAMENKQRELEEVLLRCISDKVSPLGQALERLAFNLCRETEDQGKYLKQESLKNFDAAFKTFYQIFPHGRFAHFTANSAVLEALPDDADTIHVIDYDLEGVQWAPMIEAAAQRHRKLKLTSIKRDEDQETGYAPQKWGFEETKRKLVDHAKGFGLKLEVKEIGIEDLVNEIRKTKKRGGGREFLAFNCMVELPHTGRIRSRKHVTEFLRVAKDLLSNSSSCKSNNRGIIVLGDGDACEKLRNCSSFSPFFDGYLVHYQSLLESMESNFPNHLAEARMAMECLFVWPYISSTAWYQKWEEMKEAFHFLAGFGVEEWRLSRESLMEAKEMVRDGTSYEIKVEGQNGNVMSLEWKGTTLVRVSTWANLS